MRIILVVLILMGGVISAQAAELHGRVMDVDRQKGAVTLEVMDENETIREVTVQVESIPADIRLGETILVKNESGDLGSAFVFGNVKNPFGRAANNDKTGVRSRLRKAQNGKSHRGGGLGAGRGQGHGQGQGRGHH
ncbi:hypothetical protein [uncultured Desulfuromonas sp.]|uniref:hypothetical protein n=1 Tax=uncultured Desulfuromonas sp. TaxID=181013 RepID=UPI002AAB6D3C|nr:hypothetical protein [uncultured Desulfuromonas sp.]